LKWILSKYIDKLFFKQWIIGICRGDIKSIIRSKIFDLDIDWLSIDSFDKFYADPFFVGSKDGNLKILLEEFKYMEDYGKISLLTLDKNYSETNHKILLDTKSHLSYPFVYTENNKTYIFPESKSIGKLSCFEYNSENESLVFLQDLLYLPLLDSSILKHKDKYWIFGTLTENYINYNLHIFYSDNLFGPYTPHPGNPVRSGLDGTRSAGNFITVDGDIYRPSQNCKNEYGESISISKITELNELLFSEKPYMNILVNNKKRYSGMHTIHTINVQNDFIVVDGVRWRFSPTNQFLNFFRNKIKSN
jgi:6-pyruvoyl-tetrahydropterin synthase